MKTTKEPLALRLRRARRLYADGEGLTQRQASKLAGVAFGSVGQYERARKLPEAVEILFRLARAYRIPLDALVAELVDDKITGEIEDRRSELEARRQ